MGGFCSKQAFEKLHIGGYHHRRHPLLHRQLQLFTALAPFLGSELLCVDRRVLFEHVILPTNIPEDRRRLVTMIEVQMEQEPTPARANGR